MGRKLWLSNWGLPKQILSDLDPKFLLEVWKTICSRIGTRLLYTTAHHPAGDGQSEILVQTIESAVRHFIHGMEDPSITVDESRGLLGQIQYCRMICDLGIPVPVRCSRSNTDRFVPLSVWYLLFACRVVLRVLVPRMAVYDRMYRARMIPGGRWRSHRGYANSWASPGDMPNGRFFL